MTQEQAIQHLKERISYFRNRAYLLETLLEQVESGNMDNYDYIGTTGIHIDSGYTPTHTDMDDTEPTPNPPRGGSGKTK